MINYIGKTTQISGIRQHLFLSVQSPKNKQDKAYYEKLANRVLNNYLGKTPSKEVKKELSKITAIDIDLNRGIKIFSGDKVLYFQKMKAIKALNKKQKAWIKLEPFTEVTASQSFKDLVNRQDPLKNFVSFVSWVKNVFKSFFIGKNPTYSEQKIFEQVLNLPTQIPLGEDVLFNLNLGERLGALRTVVKESITDPKKRRDLLEILSKGEAKAKKICKINQEYSKRAEKSEESNKKLSDEFQKIKEKKKTFQNETKKIKNEIKKAEEDIKLAYRTKKFYPDFQSLSRKAIQLNVSTLEHWNLKEIKSYYPEFSIDDVSLKNVFNYLVKELKGQAVLSQEDKKEIISALNELAKFREIREGKQSLDKLNVGLVKKENAFKKIIKDFRKLEKKLKQEEKKGVDIREQVKKLTDAYLKEAVASKEPVILPLMGSKADRDPVYVYIKRNQKKGKGTEFTVQVVSKDIEGRIDFKKNKQVTEISKVYEHVTAEDLATLFNENIQQYSFLPESTRTSEKLGKALNPVKELEDLLAPLASKEAKVEKEKAFKADKPFSEKLSREFRIFAQANFETIDYKRVKLMGFLSSLANFHQACRKGLGESDTNFELLQEGVNKVSRYAHKLAEEGVILQSEAEEILKGVEAIQKDLDQARLKTKSFKIGDLRKKLSGRFSSLRLRATELQLVTVNEKKFVDATEVLKQERTKEIVKGKIPDLFQTPKTVEGLLKETQKTKKNLENLYQAENDDQVIEAGVDFLIKLPPPEVKEDIWKKLSKKERETFIKQIGTINTFIFDAFQRTSKPLTPQIQLAQIASFALLDRLGRLDQQTGFDAFGGYFGWNFRVQDFLSQTEKDCGWKIREYMDSIQNENSGKPDIPFSLSVNKVNNFMIFDEGPYAIPKKKALKAIKNFREETENRETYSRISEKDQEVLNNVLPLLKKQKLEEIPRERLEVLKKIEFSSAPSDLQLVSKKELIPLSKAKKIQAILGKIKTGKGQLSKIELQIVSDLNPIKGSKSLKYDPSFRFLGDADEAFLSQIENKLLNRKKYDKDTLDTLKKLIHKFKNKVGPDYSTDCLEQLLNFMKKINNLDSLEPIVSISPRAVYFEKFLQENSKPFSFVSFDKIKKEPGAKQEHATKINRLMHLANDMGQLNQMPAAYIELKKQYAFLHEMAPNNVKEKKEILSGKRWDLNKPYFVFNEKKKRLENPFEKEPIIQDPLFLPFYSNPFDDWETRFSASDEPLQKGLEKNFAKEPLTHRQVIERLLANNAKGKGIEDILGFYTQYPYLDQPEIQKDFRNYFFKNASLEFGPNSVTNLALFLESQIEWYKGKNKAETVGFLLKFSKEFKAFASNHSDYSKKADFGKDKFFSLDFDQEIRNFTATFKESRNIRNRLYLSRFLIADKSRQSSLNDQDLIDLAVFNISSNLAPIDEKYQFDYLENGLLSAKKLLEPHLLKALKERPDFARKVAKEIGKQFDLEGEVHKKDKYPTIRVGQSAIDFESNQVIVGGKGLRLLPEKVLTHPFFKGGFSPFCHLSFVLDPKDPKQNLSIYNFEKQGKDGKKIACRVVKDATDKFCVQIELTSNGKKGWYQQFPGFTEDPSKILKKKRFERLREKIMHHKVGIRLKAAKDKIEEKVLGRIKEYKKDVDDALSLFLAKQDPNHLEIFEDSGVWIETKSGTSFSVVDEELTQKYVGKVSKRRGILEEVNKVSGKKKLKLLNSSKSSLGCWSQFEEFVPLKHIRIWGEKGRPQIIEIPAYDLSFEYDGKNKRFTCSKTGLEDFFISEKQTLPEKGNLSQSLVLQNEKGEKKVLVSGRDFIGYDRIPNSRKRNKLLTVIDLLKLKLPQMYHFFRFLPRWFSVSRLEIHMKTPALDQAKMGNLYTFSLASDGTSLCPDSQAVDVNLLGHVYLMRHYINSKQFDLAATQLKFLKYDKDYGDEEKAAFLGLFSDLKLAFPADFPGLKEGEFRLVESFEDLKEILKEKPELAPSWLLNPNFLSCGLKFLATVGKSRNFTRQVVSEDEMKNLKKFLYMGYIQAAASTESTHKAFTDIRLSMDEELELINDFITEELSPYTEKKELAPLALLLAPFGISLKALKLELLPPNMLNALIPQILDLQGKEIKELEKKEASLESKIKKAIEKGERGESLTALRGELEKIKKQKKELESSYKLSEFAVSRLMKILPVFRPVQPLPKEKFQPVLPEDLAKKIHKIRKARQDTLQPEEKFLKELTLKYSFKEGIPEGYREQYSDKASQTLFKYLDAARDMEAAGFFLPDSLGILREQGIPDKLGDMVDLFRSINDYLAQSEKLRDPNQSVEGLEEVISDLENIILPGRPDMTDKAIQVSQKQRVFKPMLPILQLQKIFRIRDRDGKGFREKVGKKIKGALDAIKDEAAKAKKGNIFENHQKPIGKACDALSEGFDTFDQEYDYQIGEWIHQERDLPTVQEAIDTFKIKNDHRLSYLEEEIDRILDKTGGGKKYSDYLERLAGKYQKPSRKLLNNLFLQKNLHTLAEKNSALTQEDIERLENLIFQRNFTIRNVQCSARARDYLKKAIEQPSEKGTFLKRAFDELKCECFYDPWYEREFLVLETEADLRLWERQVTTLREVIHNPKGVKQLIMGSGKSKVILPLIALLRADGKNLAMLSTTKSLFKSLQASMSKTNREAFEQACYVFEWERYSFENLKNRSNYLYQDLIDVIKKKKFVLATRESLEAFKATYKLYENKIFEEDVTDPETLKVYEDLHRVITLFKEKGYMMCDEVDKMMDPKEKTVFTLDKGVSFTEDAKLKEQLDGAEAVFKLLAQNKEAGLAANKQSNLTDKDQARVFRSIAQEIVRNQTDLLSNYQREQRDIRKDEKRWVDYLCGKPDKQLDAFFNHSKNQEKIATIRGLLSSVLKTGLKGVNRIRFIRSEDGIHVIPCSEKDVPKEGSQFGHRLETLTYLYMNYIQEGIEPHVLEKGVKKFQTNAEQESQVEKVNLSETPTGRVFKTIFEKDLTEIKSDEEGRIDPEDLEALAKTVSGDYESLFEFIRNTVLSEPLIFSQNIEVDGHEFSAMFQCCGGVSGSLNPGIFPNEMDTAQAVDKTTDIRTIYLMFKNEEKLKEKGEKLVSVYDSTPLHKKGEAPTSLTKEEQVAHFLSKVADVALVVDGGGLIRLSDEEVAKINLKQNKINTEFFNKKGVTEELKGPHSKKKQVFLGQNLARGADVKLEPDAVSKCTIAENMTMEELLQMVYRLRQLHEDQIAKIVVADWILKHLNVGSQKELTFQKILQYVILNKVVNESDNNFRSEKGKMLNCARRAIEQMCGNLSSKERAEVKQKYFKKYLVSEASNSSASEFRYVGEFQSPTEQLIAMKKDMEKDFKKISKKILQENPSLSFVNNTLVKMPLMQMGKNKEIEDFLTRSLPTKEEIKKKADLFAKRVQKVLSDQEGTDVQVETQTETALEVDIVEETGKAKANMLHKKRKIGGYRLQHLLRFDDSRPGNRPMMPFNASWAESFFYEASEEIFPGFHPRLKFTHNWCPVSREGALDPSVTPYRDKLIPFSTPFQAPVHEIAYVLNKRTGSLKAYILSKEDRDGFLESIGNENLGDYEISVVDLRLEKALAETKGWKRHLEGNKGFLHTYNALAVQAKLLQGRTSFNQKDLKVLRRWLDELAAYGGKETLLEFERFFTGKVLSLYPEKREIYKESPLCKVIHEIVDQYK